LINNKSPFVTSSWSHTYLLIKDAQSLEHRMGMLGRNLDWGWFCSHPSFRGARVEWSTFGTSGAL